jgi:predicted histone-like DNA-binding protein
MTINYRIIEKVLPPSQGAEKKSKYYMVVNSKEEMDLDAITALIGKNSTVHGADIRAVLYALMDVAIDGLKSGHIVRLGDLGSLRMIVNSEGRDTPKEVNATAVKGCKIHFAPSKKLKNIRKEVKFKKIPGN